MSSIGAISSAWAVRSSTAGEANVFKRAQGSQPEVWQRRASSDQGPPSDSESSQADEQKALGQGQGQGQGREKGGAQAQGKAQPDTRVGGQPGAPAEASAKVGPRKLKPAEAHQVEELSARDREVRAHEAAHQAAAGSLGGAASFTYETGPDGKSYAVGGEVPVDMSGGRTPEDTLTRAEQIRAAALAPADPSPQDLAVAAAATAMEAAARQQMSLEQSAALRAAPAQATQSSPRPARRQAETALPGSRPKQGEPASQEPASQVDVGEQAAATLAAVERARVSSGPSVAQLQQLAHLASFAYQRSVASTI